MNELLTFFAVALGLLGIALVYFYHQQVSSPLAPGRVLRSGGYISPCGILSDVPLGSLCSNDATTFFLSEQGDLTLKKRGGETLWEKKGAGQAGDDLRVSDAGQVYVGSK